MKSLASFLCVLITGCAVSGSPASEWDQGEQFSTSTQYVNIMDFASTDQGAWYDLVRKLNGEFDQVCGDTFCEGDFSNITALNFFCSVTSKVGNIHDCAWTFTASQHEVDTKTAAVVGNVVTYQCHFKPATTGTKLIALLQGSTDALHLPLPGMGSIYDSLGDCFQHPIGATPILTR